MKMQLGAYLPTVGRNVSRERIARAAEAAEAAGLDSVWVPDHVVIPSTSRSRYPYAQDVEQLVRPGAQFIDPLTALTVAAVVTDRVGLGTGILIAPGRNPVELAHRIASLDTLADGRVTVGLGAGWLREELESLGVDFDRRGAWTDEAIGAMRALWSGEEASFRGEHVSFEGMWLAARPGRAGGPPIWLGGNSPPAIRRAARLGDGWLGLDLGAEGIHDARRLLASAERSLPDPARLGVVRSVLPPDSPVSPETHSSLIGPDPAHAAAELEAVAGAGASLVVLQFLTPAKGLPDAFSWFAQEVLKRTHLAG